MSLGRRLSLSLKIAKRPAKKVKPVEEVDDPPPSVIEIIDDVLRRRTLVDQQDRRTKEFRYFRPSALFGCKRAAFFFYMNSPSHPQRQDERMMKHLDIGTAIHRMVQGWLADHPDWWFAPESRVWKKVAGTWIRGSCDGVLIRRSDGYRVGIEIKTKVHSSFLKVTEPDHWHILQATIYARLQKLDWIIIIYYDKDKQVMKEFAVQPDEERWGAVVKRVKLLRGYIDRKKLPVYVEADCDPTFCGFVDHCRAKGAPV